MEKQKNLLVTYCQNCPNNSINSKYCYNGKPCDDCPALDNIDSKKHPDDICDMLAKG